jgi:hypothetical protein
MNQKLQDYKENVKILKNNRNFKELRITYKEVFPLNKK